MHFPLHLLIPLACALGYVVAALMMKRAAELGVGVWRTSFVANAVMAAVFLPGWFLFDGELRPWNDYWQPALTGLCYLGGQVCLFLALSRGDVSVTTPVMGSKVVLVALFSSVLRVGEVPLAWWIGAGLSTAAVGLLHAGERHGERRQVGRTVLLATASAASFGLGDVLMQKWVPAWGAVNFFPPMFGLVLLYSYVFVPFFSAPLRRLTAPAWRWVGPGALFMALTNAGIVLTLGVWGDATAVNIVFSARGLFSVVLVWAVGHWFASTEQHLAPRVLGYRLAGAALMLAAIALVLV